ncbi:MAG: DUF378 domain-containing protein [bacterium]|nr:DUF378 domain-containing protein [bacterium]
MKSLHIVAFALLAIGGINWGLIGLGMYMGSDWNLVSFLFGAWPALINLVYVLVGLSALIVLFSHRKDCRVCDVSGSGM